MAHLVTVIYSSEAKGKGIEGDPCRMVNQLYLKDGTLLASQDTWSNEAYINNFAMDVLRRNEQ